MLEGTQVRTSRGLVSTAHVLFICAGAFHLAKPSELLPELQGRLPVRVALQPLTEADFVRILRDTQFNLLMQQQHLPDLKVHRTNLKEEEDHPTTRELCPLKQMMLLTELIGI